VNIRNLQEANEALQSYADRDPKHIGRNYTLKRVFPLMEAAGNPQDRLKVVHIAGTSGNTSQQPC
jgi:folylpolyglutamate synthase/dihydropteroate synthase